MLNKIRKWLADHRLVFYKTMKVEIRDGVYYALERNSNENDQRAAEINQRHRKQIEALVEKKSKQAEVAQALIDRLSHFDWRPGTIGYSLTIHLDPHELFRHGGDKRQQEFIAEHLGRRVMGDIVTSKFVEVSNEFLRRECEYSGQQWELYPKRDIVKDVQESIDRANKDTGMGSE